MRTPAASQYLAVRAERQAKGESIPGDTANLSEVETDMVGEGQAAQGVFTLAGGGLSNATVTADTALTGMTSCSTLFNVTLNGDLDMPSGRDTIIYMYNGWTFNGTMHLGGTGSNYGRLYIDGTQTLSGNGNIIFGSGTSNGRYSTVHIIQETSTITFGPNVTIRGHTGWGRVQHAAGIRFAELPAS